MRECAKHILLQRLRYKYGDRKQSCSRVHLPLFQETDKKVIWNPKECHTVRFRKMAATYRSRNSTAKPADVLKISSPCIFLTYNQLCLYWNFFLSLLSQHLKNIFGLWHFEKRRCIISSSEETALLRALVRTVLAADSPILKPCFEQLITTVCVELVFSLLKHFHSPLSVSF